MTFLRSTPANRCNSAPDSPCGRSSSKRERYLRISVAWGSSESASGDTSKWISSGLPTTRTQTKTTFLGPIDHQQQLAPTLTMSSVTANGGQQLQPGHGQGDQGPLG